MRCLRRILNITWQDKVPNNTVLERAGLSSMFAMLKQRRLRWLGHVVRMDDGRIPKDLLYGELVQGKRATGSPYLRYKDVCKRDLKALSIDLSTWENLTLDRSAWRQAVHQGLSHFEETFAQRNDAKRQQKRVRNQGTRPATDHVCLNCGRDCHSRIGLDSHAKRCNL